MEASLQAGAILEERYRLESLLGRGGSGQVWAAYDQEEGRPVALKVMHREGSHRTRREVEALGRLHHPAIVRFLGEGLIGRLPFVVLELVEGETLRVHLARRALERRPFAAAELLELFAPILGALTEAHDQNVIHRDLKPENLVLDRGGRLRILDFGVARLTDTPATAATTLGRMIGSLFYLSPEQSLGHAIDARSDLFSLAVVVYECLTLHRAWAKSESGGLLSVAEPARVVDNTPVQIITRITSGPRPSAFVVAPWLGPKIDGFFARALAIEPQQRQTSMITFGRELAQALAEAGPPPLGSPTALPTEVRGETIDWSTTQPVEARQARFPEPPLDATEVDSVRLDRGTVATLVEERPGPTRVDRPLVTVVPPDDGAGATRTTENQYLPRTVTRPAVGARPRSWRPWMFPLFAAALIVGTAAGMRLGAHPGGAPAELNTGAPKGSPPQGTVVVPLPNATQTELEAPAQDEASPTPPEAGRAPKKSGGAKRTANSGPSELSTSLAALQQQPDPAAFRRLLALVRQRAAELPDPERRQEVERLLFLASAAEDLSSLEKAIERLQAP
ncbi:MAG: protein kinase [Deltaproteobacteria bacterium]|nr:protein kinase [Deltaproteobacteria bacterium]